MVDTSNIVMITLVLYLRGVTDLTVYDKCLAHHLGLLISTPMFIDDRLSANAERPAYHPGWSRRYLPKATIFVVFVSLLFNTSFEGNHL